MSSREAAQVLMTDAFLDRLADDDAMFALRDLESSAAGGLMLQGLLRGLAFRLLLRILRALQHWKTSGSQ